jgi:hypothetical protein
MSNSGYDLLGIEIRAIPSSRIRNLGSDRRCRRVPHRPGADGLEASIGDHHSSPVTMGAGGGPTMKRKRLMVVTVAAGGLVAIGLARRAKAAQDSIRIAEVETAAVVDDRGDLVVDDLLVAVDSEGTIVATDETVAVVTPEGVAVIDEKLSVAGDDGELHTVEEDISVIEVDDE